MSFLEKRIDEHGDVLVFEGFPREGLAFLRRLKRNNRRDWFQPRKAEYEALLVKPMRAFIVELGARLSSKLPGVRFDPKRAVYRIYRDVRFSEDKSPYKTHIAAHVSFTQGADSRPGLYLHVAPGDIFYGGGLYMPSPAQLKKIRLRINNDPESFKRLVKAPALRRTFGGMSGEPLKRAPKGWPSDHPYLEFLKMKQFFAGKQLPESVCLRRDFATKAARELSVLIPLLKWLQETA